MQTKTGQDLPLLKLTSDNYLVPKGEEHLYHVRIEVKKFDTESGERLSIPRIQKFGETGYKTSIAKNLKKQGFTLDVLHNPSEWLKEQAELRKTAIQDAANRKMQAQEQKEIEAADATQQLIDAAVEKALLSQGQATQKAIDEAVAKALASVKLAKTDAKATEPIEGKK